jgi:predicted transcriptional regulator
MDDVTMPGTEVLAKMRKVLGMPQAELAQRTGIERTVLSYWETGQKPLSEEQIDRVASVIQEETRRRAEEATILHAMMDVPAADRARQMRGLRLEWGVTQAELSAATGLGDNLLSMWEHGYVQLDQADLAKLSDALLIAINKRSAMLAWYLNPSELERRREALGISRKRLARHFNKPESWVIGLESGEVPLDEDIVTPIWEYIAGIEVEQGKQTELRSALSAPVRMAMTVEKPITLHKKERIVALQKKVVRLAAQNVELRKIADLAQEMNRNSSEANVLLTHLVSEMEEKIAAMQTTVGQMPATAERDQFVGLLNELMEVIEQ